MYVVMKVLKEREIAKGDYIKGTVSFEDIEIGLFGMLPVFDTLEKAKKLFPDDEIIEVKLKD